MVPGLEGLFTPVNSQPAAPGVTASAGAEVVVRRPLIRMAIRAEDQFFRFPVRSMKINYEGSFL